MRFRFAARVIAQLGAELISSDEIALFELVKNGFDAGSPVARVEIRYLLPVSLIRQLEHEARRLFHAGETLDRVRAILLQSCQPPTDTGQPPGELALPPQAFTELQMRLEQQSTNDALIRELRALNTIRVIDDGHGMTEDALAQHFLTIGTTFRYEQHRAYEEGATQGGIPPAGEKGIGRLSAMRLGNDLSIHTWVKDASEEHLLVIDWRLFHAHAAAAANDIPVQYEPRPRQHAADSSGTILTVSDLHSSWDRAKTVEVTEKSLSRFMDPFTSRRTRIVKVSWNEEPLTIPPVGRSFLDAAHNGMRGSLTFHDHDRFQLNINYWFANENGEPQRFARTYTSADFDKLTDADVVQVGPFEFELYHYNRRKLRDIPLVATRQEFKAWLDSWCGGLMLYRDGIRVMPYGRMPDDDWLGLDEMALRGKGFRVNRIQTTGCVRISRSRNPLLQDQTNREGLIDNPASHSFRRLLRRTIRELFVRELDRSQRADEGAGEHLAERSNEAQSLFEEAAEELIQAAAAGNQAAFTTARERLHSALNGLRRLNEEVERALATRELQKTEILELAATGLSAESLAHDLEASLDAAMSETLGASRSLSSTSTLRSSLDHLRAVFKSLIVQIAAIKPGPAKRRRRPSKFDVRTILDQVTTFYASNLQQNEIALHVETGPADRPFRIRAVDGHVRQILDNILRNAIYWIVDTRAKYPDTPEGIINITLDYRSRQLIIQDSGVGVAQEDVEWVFEAFNTHREGGHGLGLYIARELGHFNGIDVTIDRTHRNRWNRHDRFLVNFSNCFVEE